MHAPTKKNLIKKKSVSYEKSISAQEVIKDICGDRPEWAVLFRGLRYKEELTQIEMAELTGLSQTTISDIERGRRPIGKTVAKRIANIFKIDYRLFL